MLKAMRLSSEFRWRKGKDQWPRLGQFGIRRSGDAAEESQKDEQGGEVPWEPQEARQGRGVRAQPCWTLWTDHRTTENALTIRFSNMEVAGDLVRGSLLGTKGWLKWLKTERGERNWRMQKNFIAVGSGEKGWCLEGERKSIEGFHVCIFF